MRAVLSLEQFPACRITSAAAFSFEWDENSILNDQTFQEASKLEECFWQLEWLLVVVLLISVPCENISGFHSSEGSSICHHTYRHGELHFLTAFGRGISLVLNNHDTTGTRKQKFIGTRKHNSEAVETSHEHVNKDSDGSTKDVSIKNIQGTSIHITSGDKGSIGGDDAKEKRRGGMSGVVEPRSYRDVLMNGEEQQTMT